MLGQAPWRLPLHLGALSVTPRRGDACRTVRNRVGDHRCDGALGDATTRGTGPRWPRPAGLASRWKPVAERWPRDARRRERRSCARRA